MINRKYYLTGTIFIVCTGIVLLTFGQIHVAQGTRASGGDINVTQLLSAQEPERLQVLEGFCTQYNDISATLQMALRKASVEHRADRRYNSPLHAAILAVNAWRVLEADTTLLYLIDYEVDPTSLPLGISVTSQSFYPAAFALIRLRVDIKEIEGMIKVTENPKQRRLLTWVLCERAGSVENAVIALTMASKKCADAKGKQNFDKATELFNNLKETTDLIPSPYSDSKPTDSDSQKSLPTPRKSEEADQKARSR